MSEVSQPTLLQVPKKKSHAEVSEVSQPSRLTSPTHVSEVSQPASLQSFAHVSEVSKPSSGPHSLAHVSEVNQPPWLNSLANSRGRGEPVLLAHLARPELAPTHVSHVSKSTSRSRGQEAEMHVEQVSILHVSHLEIRRKSRWSRCQCFTWPT